MAVLTLQFISPKGGAGASLISFELAQELALSKKKVLFAHLHGSDFWNATPGHPYLKPLEEDTQFPVYRSIKVPGLHSVCLARVETLNEQKMYDWIKVVQELADRRCYDYLIMDLQSLYFSHWLVKNSPTSKVIIVTNPDISAIQQTYNWFESLIDFHLRVEGADHRVSNLLQLYKSADSASFIPFFSWLKDNYLEVALSLDPLFAFSGFYLIVNKIRVDQDKSLVYSVPIVIRKFFGLKVSPLGCIHYDQNVWQAFRTLNSDFFGLKLEELSIGITHISRQLQALEKSERFDLGQDRAVG
jgi:MinD-like ATPase involved in chromosome partitioning or flagellar assembly